MVTSSMDAIHGASTIGVRPASAATGGTGNDSIIRLENVWKVFGADARKCVERYQSGALDKERILAETGCVVGVANASLEVRRSEIFCIMGLSGSGKSTLVRLVNRLLEPTAGQIYIYDQDVTQLSESELRMLRNRKLGMVFQHFGLMPHRTVRDNVALPLEIAGMSRLARWEKAQLAINAVGLKGWEDRYTQELSGGMQQRVGLARALAGDAEILLVDEPFSALDPLIRRQLQDEFVKLSHQFEKTTLFITHDLDEAIRIGSRIAIMKQGEIVQLGQPDEIIMNPVDDYVKDFVSGISKVQFLSVQSIMRPLPAGLDGLMPEVPAGMQMHDLINILTEHDGPVCVVENGVRVGIVSVRDVLRHLDNESEV